MSSLVRLTRPQAHAILALKREHLSQRGKSLSATTLVNSIRLWPTKHGSSVVEPAAKVLK
jgi:hypothetical protein